MKIRKYHLLFLLTTLMLSCNEKQEPLEVEVYETSAQGNSLKRIAEFIGSETPVKITLNPEEKFQNDILRPIIKLGNDQLAISDLNRLYQYIL